MSQNGVKVDITIPTDEYCVVVDGPKTRRDQAYATVMDKRPDYLILSYESVVSDWREVRRIEPGAIFLDEVTAIKTFKAARSKKIKRLQAEYRYGLTGTPVENGKPEEVYSIMEWIDKDVLGRFDMFERSFIVRNGFGGIERYKNLPTLHAKLATAMVRKRRMDPDVRKYLPEVQEETVIVDMPPRLKFAYQALASDLLEELRQLPPGSGFNVAAYYAGTDQGGDMSQAGRIMARMQAVDMLLDHPSLVLKSAADYAFAQEQQEAGVLKANWSGSKYAYEVVESGLITADLPTPKMDRLVEDINVILESGPANKIIVFSVHPDALEELAVRLEGKTGVVQYHGGMNGAQKAAAVATYSTDPDCRVILCSHAGAFGTDLHMANYLLNLDIAWSSGTQDQINARHVRVASKFEHVFIRNYIVGGTTEQRKLDLLEHKRRVASAIIDGTGADEKTGTIDNDVASLTEAVSGTV
jgi:SNF2 family DNA or RNA helicase